MVVCFFRIIFNYKNGGGKKKKIKKRNTNDVWFPRLLATKEERWCLKQTIAHGRSVPYGSNVYMVHNKKCLIIEKKGVFAAVDRARWSRLFSAMAKRKLRRFFRQLKQSLSIFNIIIPTEGRQVSLQCLPICTRLVTTFCFL